MRSESRLTRIFPGNPLQAIQVLRTVNRIRMASRPLLEPREMCCRRRKWRCLPPPLLPAGSVGNGASRFSRRPENRRRARPVSRSAHPRYNGRIVFRATPVLSVLLMIGLVHIPDCGRNGEVVVPEAADVAQSADQMRACGRAEQRKYSRLLQSLRPHRPVGRRVFVRRRHVIAAPDGRARSVEHMTGLEGIEGQRANPPADGRLVPKFRKANRNCRVRTSRSSAVQCAPPSMVR